MFIVYRCQHDIQYVTDRHTVNVVPRDARIPILVLGIEPTPGISTRTRTHKIATNTTTLIPLYGSAQFTAVDCKVGSEESP